MESIVQLRLIAQMSVSLAGFAGVVVSFQYLQAIKVTRGDALGLVMMVNISLVNSFFALLPIILTNFAIKEESTIWAICSAASAFNYVIFFCYIQSQLKQVNLRRTITKVIFKLFMCSGLLAIIVNILNAAYYREYALYFIVLVLPLIYTAYLFMRLVSRPLRRAIRQQEKDTS
jgi:hypothetical protein